MTDRSSTAVPRAALLVSVAFAVLYGLVFRIAFADRAFSDLLGVMSVAFISIVPMVVGYLAVRPSPRPEWPFAVFFPWIPTFVIVLISAVIGYEGGLCIIMALPILLVNASIGGVVAMVVTRRQAARNAGVTAAVLVFPLLFGAVERGIPVVVQYRVVANSIDIQAAPGTVWREIVSVREIQPEEIPGKPLFLRMGFPRPLSAEIDRETVGGVRKARFAGGVLFLETVTDLAQDSLLSFSIRAQTDSIPPSTLDEHVTIGGPYFDVLRGTYRIERLGADSVRLHLESRLRVSTHFNWYAGLWADAVMGSIQRNILEVERARAERR